MERLNLRTGTFVPRTHVDAETRIRALEAYVSSLSVDLEFMLGEVNTALSLLMQASALDGQDATAAVVDMSGEVGE